MESDNAFIGSDKFWKNENEMMMRLNTTESEDRKYKEEKNIEDLLSNDTYADRTIAERFHTDKEGRDSLEEHTK